MDFFIMESPINMDDLEENPLFSETSNIGIILSEPFRK